MNILWILYQKELRDKIKARKGTNRFNFGSSKEFPSIKYVALPCFIGVLRVDINPDIVESDKTLLLSNTAIKKAGTKLDFTNDSVQIFGKIYNLECTDTGHYLIPITKQLSRIKK